MNILQITQKAREKVHWQSKWYFRAFLNFPALTSQVLEINLSLCYLVFALLS